MKDYKLIPVWMDPKIVDMTRLIIYFGSLRKKFETYEEMVKWKKKANRLSPGWKAQ